jgi:hypothetical protein
MWVFVPPGPGFNVCQANFNPIIQPLIGHNHKCITSVTPFGQEIHV